MKKTLLVLLFILLINSASAQTENKKNRISFATTAGTGIAVSIPSSTPFLWQFSGYYNLTERFFAGAGTGLSLYEELLIPLYGDIKYQIGRTRKITSFAELGIGYSFAPNNGVNGGFFMNPTVGIQYPLNNSLKLQIAAGYELQRLERLKKKSDSYFEKEFAEKLSHNSISLKLGLWF